MSEDLKTIADRLQNRLDTLTRAERQLAHAILENYPVSGLGPIASVAQNAEVSTPTVARMVQKLGFKGYAEFQAELRGEIQAKISGPIAKRDTWAQKAPVGHVLNRFTEAVIDNIRHSLGQIETESFDEACQLIGDRDHPLFIVGGRITHTMAEYLFLHMQVIRNNTTHIHSTSNAWPHYLLDVKEGDVFVIFDMRRYENNTLKLAKMAHQRGAKIILFTDQWRSPIHTFSHICFSSRIVVPSAWDSAATTLLLVETVIAAVQEQNWENTRSRMETLEGMFDKTKLFRKFT